MKLMLVNSAWPESWGGGEKWTVEAAKWFIRNGHDVCVVGRPKSRLVSAAQNARLTTAETRFGGDFDPAAVIRAAYLITGHQPHMLVVNFNKEAWQFGLAAKLSGVPVIARHGYPVLSASFHHRFLANHLLTRIIVNAPSIHAHYRSLGISSKRMDVVLNGVSPHEPKPGAMRQRFRIPLDVPLIAGCGRLETQKRFDLFLEIAIRILRHFPNCRFVIFGEGPLRSILEAMAGKYGLSDHLVLAGFTDDFAEIISDADLFLLTSENEGTPNALLEAMVAGVPCVAFEVGAVSEILIGSLSSYRIAFGDVESAAAQVRLLLGDDLQRRACGDACRERALSDFSWDHSLAQFMNRIESCL